MRYCLSVRKRCNEDCEGIACKHRIIISQDGVHYTRKDLGLDLVREPDPIHSMRTYGVAAPPTSAQSTVGYTWVSGHTVAS